MRNEEQLVETHVVEYESRLKYIDELIVRAGKTQNQKPQHKAELAELKQERDKLADHLEEIKQLSLEEWAKEGGPMVLWDIVAGRLEQLVEHLE